MKSLMGTGVSFASKIIDLVYQYTEGHPFEMQVLCYHLFNSQLSRRVDIDVWEKTLQTSLRDLGVSVFDNWSNSASEEEYKVLRIMAMANGMGITSVQNIQKMAANYKIKIASKSVSKYLQRLVEKELIERCGRGEYRIPDLMFRAYLSKHQEEQK